jgi:hypothetical protein
MDDFTVSPDAFESIRVSITFKNDTSKTAVKEKGRVQVLELSELGMGLEVPRRSCATGHVLTLDFEVKVPGEAEPFKFSSGMKVDLCEAFGERDQISVTLTQGTSADWEWFRGLFERRQGEIEEFFKAVKGT